MQHEPTMTHPTPQQGFTLLELMITVAIAAILLAVAIPSFQLTMARAQLTTKTNDFLAGLASARNEAIKNNTRAVMCASTNGTTCTAGGSWTGGWLVFVDTNRNGVLNAGETITNVRPAVNAIPAVHGLTIVGNATVNDTITFSSDGLLFGLPGTVQVCNLGNALPNLPPDLEKARDIVINRVGRTRIEAAVGTCP
jgi:type IV fimbrial biogenesis protein FimT